MSSVVFRPVADSALLIELGDQVDDLTNQKVISLDQAISNAAICGVVETIPALVNLLVVFDPVTTDFIEIRSKIETLLPIEPKPGKRGKTHVLNACYESEIAPDLAAVAKSCGMSPDEVINLHTSAEFRVGMYGFVPGFAYLMGLPEQIQVPRKKEAIPNVAEGNVIIAGAQCIVTTLNMPSGWSIIGKSDAQILGDDPDKAFLFNVGDTVVFKRVSLNELKWTA
ncbi:MAG: allophanate hydrolase subunit 1 [Pseudomonadota bacterium]